MARALMSAAAAPDYPARVVALGTDRRCPATEHARAAGVATFLEELTAQRDRAAWDRALTAQVAAHEPDLVVLAGFLRVLGPVFVDRFADRIINSHPALLPAFPGPHAVRDALAYGVRVTGTTMMLVDAGIDTGPILAQEAVAVIPGEDEATLHERIKVVERRLLVEIVAAIATGGVVVAGRKAVIGDERVLR